METRGTSRNLGALDLNANYFKSLRVWNPSLISNHSVADIKDAFRPLKRRPILRISDELTREDRIRFDNSVLRAYGIDESILPSLYDLLTSAVHDRVSMRDR